jgi:hypothetical protein
MTEQVSVQDASKSRFVGHKAKALCSIVSITVKILKLMLTLVKMPTNPLWLPKFPIAYTEFMYQCALYTSD